MPGTCRMLAGISISPVQHAVALRMAFKAAVQAGTAGGSEYVAGDGSEDMISECNIGLKINESGVGDEDAGYRKFCWKSWGCVRARQDRLADAQRCIERHSGRSRE